MCVGMLVHGRPISTVGDAWKEFGKDGLVWEIDERPFCYFENERPYGPRAPLAQDCLCDVDIEATCRANGRQHKFLTDDAEYWYTVSKRPLLNRWPVIIGLILVGLLALAYEAGRLIEALHSPPLADAAPALESATLDRFGIPTFRPGRWHGRTDDGVFRCYGGDCSKWVGDLQKELL